MTALSGASLMPGSNKEMDHREGWLQETEEVADRNRKTGFPVLNAGDESGGS